MAVILSKQGLAEVSGAVGALREWQHDEVTMQLHPGDLGWFWRFGIAAIVAAVRTWSRDDRMLAVALLDGPDLARVTTAPDASQDEELAQQVVADLIDPNRGILPTGEVSVEARTGSLVPELLGRAGRRVGEQWTPLRRDLAARLPDPGIRIDLVDPQQAHLRAAVHQASFGSAEFTEDRWRAMADGLPYADARCLVAFNTRGEAVAAATVWSAGVGKPGVLEPLGVHSAHRGHGYGQAIALAAAAALQSLGASCAMVCTPSSNLGAVATYKAAGFGELPVRFDRTRDT